MHGYRGPITCAYMQEVNVQVKFCNRTIKQNYKYAFVSVCNWLTVLLVVHR